MDNRELGSTAVCTDGYAWKGKTELDTPTLVTYVPFPCLSILPIVGRLQSHAEISKAKH